MCVTINDRTALKVTDVGLKLHHPKNIDVVFNISYSWVKIRLHMLI